MSVVVYEKRYDAAFLSACAVLLFIGLMTLFSLGLAKSENWFYKQSFHALLAVILFIGASRLSVSQWKLAAPYLAVGAIALLFSTLLFGDSHKGATRWINVGLNMQPVEYFKFAFLLIGARQCARAALTNFGLDMIKRLFLWLFLPLCILLYQPDFGSFCLITAVAIVMLFLAGLRARWFILALLVFAGIAYFLVQNSDYRLERLLSFWDPFDDRYGSDYNLNQSLMSYARGGFMGAGAGAIVAGRNLPEAHNDFIIAVIAEENGLVGVIGVCCLLIFVISRIAAVGLLAKQVGDMFGAFYAFGLSVFLTMQMIINIGGSLALLPIKGLTLPLLSYGGSSLTATALMLGVAARVDYECRQIRTRRQ